MSSSVCVWFTYVCSRTQLLMIMLPCCRCVLELHAIASKKAEGGGRFAVAMTAQENQRYLAGISNDYKQYYSMLGRVNVEASDCSRAEDRESIHEGIRCSVGFARLSRMVFGVMEGWMEEELKGQAAASAAAGDEKRAMEWNATLATMLLQQGRHEDAILIFELNLEYARRVLPENHPNIGEMLLLFCWFDVCFDLVCSRHCNGQSC
jgi:hypothetical protein